MSEKKNKKENSIFSGFVNQYSVSKTLRFGLEPVGATVQIIRELKEEQDFDNPLTSLIHEDKEKADAYIKVKKYIDDLHRDFLSFSLNLENFSEENKSSFNNKINSFYNKYKDNYEKKKELKKEKKKKDKNEKKISEIEKSIDSNNKEILNTQKELAKELKSTLDINAPKFFEEKFTNQKQEVDKIIESKQEKLDEGKKNIKYLNDKIKNLTKEQGKEKENLEKQKEQVNKQIKVFERELKELKNCQNFKFSKSDNLYDKTKNLFPLLRLYYIDNEEITKSIKKFDGFHSYFTGFNENRQNVYDIDNKNSKDDIFKSTSIVYRLFEQNIKFYCNNILKWHELQKYLNKSNENQLSKLEELKEKKWNFEKKIKEVKNKLDFKIEDFFNIDCFSKYFSQEGIDKYNLILGGKKAEEGKDKIQGINEVINLTRQQLQGDRKNFPVLQEFYKQILSEKEVFIENITDNKNLIDEINKFIKKEKKFITDLTERDKKEGNLAFEELLENNRNNLDNIYISKDILRFFSQDLVGSWNGLETWYLNSLDFDDNQKKKQEKRRVYTFGELQNSLNEKREWIDPEEEQKESANFYTKFVEKNKKEIENISNDKKQNDIIKKKWLENLEEENILFSYLKSKFNFLLKERDENYKNLEESKILVKDRKELKTPFKREQKKIIKKYLDSSQDLYRFLRNLNIKEKDFTGEDKNAQQNEAWKETIKRFIDPEKNNISKLYNLTRNFLTKKSYSKEKFKLNFENPTLADGWDKNKETDNTCVILMKDDEYFLGVMNKENNTIFDFDKLNKDLKDKKNILEKKKDEFTKKKEGTKTYKDLLEKIQILRNEIVKIEENLNLINNNDSSCYEKINYKQVANPKLDIHNLIYIEEDKKTKRFTKNLDKIREKNCPEIQDIRKKGTYKGNNIIKNDLIVFIEYYKKCALDYWDWADLKFQETKKYKNIKQFTDDINKQAYKITFDNTSESYINKMVEKKKLYLFKISSKDFSKKKKNKGTDNLNTIYWKAIFEKQNLENVVIKLNGQAELFYRKASLKNSFKHKKDEVLKHKSYREEWKELGLEINHQSTKKEEIEKHENLKIENNQVIYKEKIIGRIIEEQQKEITKDKRYTKDKILFHCPITLNFKSKGKEYFNNEVNQFLKDNHEKINIIGIDRGEKNLLYYSVINQQEKILEQDSFNSIDSGFKPAGSNQTVKIDYHHKLDDKEKQRTKARKDWETIGNIKELKEGYLSQVVHQLCNLIIKYNAIVVLEDLNTGFKRGRFKFEKQVYQKFETALIKKLNYLVFKKINPLTKEAIKFNEKIEATGHYLRAYQLTNKFKTFSEIVKQKQSGILFYTAAGYTSKTDPITGYMRGLYPKYKDVKQAQEFFKKFKFIKYNGKHFEFNYNLKDLKGMTGSYDDKQELDEGKINKNWTIHSYVERTRYTKITLEEEEKKLEEYKNAVNGKWGKNIDAEVNKNLINLFKKELQIDELDELEIKCYKNFICDKNKKELFENSKFLAKLIAHFNRLLDMRVFKGDQNNKEDFILSPVEPFFDSRKINNNNLPKDSDANGAYNIARKGIMILDRIKSAKDEEIINKKFKEKLSVTKTDWQNFCQKEEVVNQQKEKYKKIIEGKDN